MYSVPSHFPFGLFPLVARTFIAGKSFFTTEFNTGIRNASENRASVVLTAFTGVTDRGVTLTLNDVVTTSNISLKGKVTNNGTTTLYNNTVNLTNAETGTITMGDTYTGGRR